MRAFARWMLAAFALLLLWAALHLADLQTPGRGDGLPPPALALPGPGQTMTGLPPPSVRAVPFTQLGPSSGFSAQPPETFTMPPSAAGQDRYPLRGAGGVDLPARP